MKNVLITLGLTVLSVTVFAQKPEEVRFHAGAGLSMYQGIRLDFIDVNEAFSHGMGICFNAHVRVNYVASPLLELGARYGVTLTPHKEYVFDGVESALSARFYRHNRKGSLAPVGPFIGIEAALYDFEIRESHSRFDEVKSPEVSFVAPNVSIGRQFMPSDRTLVFGSLNFVPFFVPVGDGGEEYFDTYMNGAAKWQYRIIFQFGATWAI